MSGKRFKWLLIAICLTVICVAAIWKYPEVAKIQEKRESGLGKYVYFDGNNVLHVSRKCPKLGTPPLQRTRVEEFYDGYRPYGREPSICLRCVSDKDFEKLSGEE